MVFIDTPCDAADDDRSLDSFALLAVPFFVLAGNLLNIGGITERIFNFARAVFGWMRGGLAQVTIAAEMIFSGISGAALADLAGLGVVVIKAMRDQRYPVPFAAAVMLAACVLGPIIPPSIVFVIYGLATDTSVGRLFLAGIVPGIVIGVLLMLHISIYMRIKKPDWGQPEPFVATQGLDILQGGRLRTSLAVCRDRSDPCRGRRRLPRSAPSRPVTHCSRRCVPRADLKGLVECIKESVIVTAVIMYLIAVSSVMGWVVTTERIAHDAAEYIGAQRTQPEILGLLVINVLLLVVRTFLETVRGTVDPVADPVARCQRARHRPGAFRRDHFL